MEAFLLSLGLGTYSKTLGKYTTTALLAFSADDLHKTFGISKPDDVVISKNLQAKYARDQTGKHLSII